MTILLFPLLLRSLATPDAKPYATALGLLVGIAAHCAISGISINTILDRMDRAEREARQCEAIAMESSK